MNSCYPNYSYFLETRFQYDMRSLDSNSAWGIKVLPLTSETKRRNGVAQLDPEPRGTLEKLRSSHGPRPLLSTFSEEENSLWGGTLGVLLPWRYSTQKGIKIGGQMCNKWKIYYSYFIAVIELRGYILPLLKRACKWQGVNIITPLLTISSERWSQAQ